MGTSSSPLCMMPSDFRWGLIPNQTASYSTPRRLRGSPQASMGGVFPILQIVACSVWEVGPLSLSLWGCCLLAAGGSVSCSFCLNGLVLWGCTIPLWGGGFDGEATLPVWATDWRQNSGVCVTPGVVWGGIYRGLQACGLLTLIACESLLHWAAILTLCLHALWCWAVPLLW
jgi:hypothetical protein